MAEIFDITIGDDGDEIHDNGDLLVGECTLQNQKLLLITEKGTLKHEPTTGCGIASWILDEQDGQDLKAEIQDQFEGDGQTILTLKINSLTDIRIKAYYGA